MTMKMHTTRARMTSITYTPYSVAHSLCLDCRSATGSRPVRTGHPQHPLAAHYRQAGPRPTRTTAWSCEVCRGTYMVHWGTVTSNECERRKSLFVPLQEGRIGGVRPHITNLHNTMQCCARIYYT
jgi:hypothetical protein